MQNSLSLKFIQRLSISVAMFSLTVLYTAMVTAQTKDPVRITDAEFSYGQLPPNTVVSHKHWIINQSGKEVTVDTVVTGCGCATAPLTQKVIAPGDSVPVIVTFSSKNFVGSVAKRPYVKLVGSETRYGFKFYADVVTNPDELRPLAVFPPIIDFTVMTPDQTLTRKFSMANRSEEAVAVSIASAPEYFEEVGLPDTLRPGQIFEGILTAKESFRDSSFLSSVTFEVNHTALYRLSVPVFKKIDHRAEDTTAAIPGDTTADKSAN